MNIYLRDLFLINRAPFESLRLEFGQNEIVILSGVNGRGKTTIMSCIVTETIGQQGTLA
jgi:ABC-type multidrug transport system ATPase subunit